MVVVDGGVGELWPLWWPSEPSLRPHARISSKRTLPYCKSAGKNVVRSGRGIWSASICKENVVNKYSTRSPSSFGLDDRSSMPVGGKSCGEDCERGGAVVAVVVRWGGFVLEWL